MTLGQPYSGDARSWWRALLQSMTTYRQTHDVSLVLPPPGCALAGIRPGSRLPATANVGSSKASSRSSDAVSVRARHP